MPSDPTVRLMADRGPSALLHEALTVRDDRSIRGGAFCSAFTDAVNAWLVSVFEQALGSASAKGVALVAVGGHGRGELAPLSDLDLLLVRSERGLDDGVAERLWYPLWDAKFKVGHAVRTVRETLALSETDIETATALMSARLIVGDASLFDELVSGFEGQRAKRGKQWLRKLAASAAERGDAAGDVAHELEPDIKEGNGGLRSRHSIDWAEALGVAVEPADRERLEAAYELLLAVRVELHRVTSRPNNKLVLQDQDAVADALGLGDGAALMSTVSRAAREISWIADTVWATVGSRRSRISRSRYRVLRDDPDLGATVALGPFDVALADEADPSVDARASLRLAVVSAERGLPIARSSLAALHRAPSLSDPWPADARRLLVRLLAAGSGCIDVIETLDRNDLWVKLIPEWAGAQCRPQRNPYHRWNVDRHLTETVARAAPLVGRVNRPDLLLLAALLHDIGKGVPGHGLDHSETGAELAKVITKRMGLDDHDASVVVALVHDHLLLPDVATRRDLDDPATIANLVERVGTNSRLHLLAALAEADGRATGASAWGAWKADLVRSLVQRVERAFTTTDQPLDLSESVFPRPEHLALVERGKPEFVANGDVLTVCWPDQVGLFASIAGVLALSGMEILSASVGSVNGMAIDEIRVRTASGDPPDWDRTVDQLTQAFAGRLALRARVAERAASYRTRRMPGNITEPSVAFEGATDATIIEVSSPDSVGLLYRLTSTLAEMHLDIRRATVATIGPDVVDTFYVVDTDGGALTDQRYMTEIRTALAHAALAPTH